MKEKALRRKIAKLEARLVSDAEKLARWKRRLPAGPAGGKRGGASRPDHDRRAQPPVPRQPRSSMSCGTIDSASASVEMPSLTLKTLSW
jgi:hypothetical protein